MIDWISCEGEKELKKIQVSPAVPLCFYERPTLVPVFANLKEGFHFYEKW